ARVTDFASYSAVVEKLIDGRRRRLLFRGQRREWPLVPKIGRVKLRQPLLQAEREMLSALKRRALPLLHTLPESDLEWLPLGQHHGMATRLLDWTENPLTALWFAVRRPPEADEYGDPEPGVVWCLTADEETVIATDEAASSGRKETIVLRPRHITQRIAAQ